MKSAAAKYDAGAQVGGKGWLCLHRNENLFIDPDWEIEFTAKALHQVSISSYPDPTCQELRGAIARFYKVTPDNIFVGNGSDEVLSNLFALLRSSFDHVGILDICFKMYPVLAERFGYQIQILPGDTFHTGKIAVNNWVGLAVIDSPNAITGTQFNIEHIWSPAKDDRSFLIWDNAYGEFSSETLPGNISKNVVIVKTFSKFYGLAGIRIGYCIADRVIIDALLERKDAFNVNGMAQLMALEALRRRDVFHSLSREMLECRREMASRLQGLKFQIRKSSSNFILVMHSTCQAEVIQNELSKHRIAVRWFQGSLTENHLRITVPPMSGVERLTDALSEILENV